MSKKKEPTFEYTKYGFKWGALEMTRTCSHKGAVVCQIHTPKLASPLTLCVTASGIIELRDGNNTLVYECRKKKGGEDAVD